MTEAPRVLHFSAFIICAVWYISPFEIHLYLYIAILFFLPSSLPLYISTSPCIYMQYADAKPSNVLELGSGPIRSVCQLRDSLYVSCGQDIVVIEMARNTVEASWRAVQE